MTETEIAELLRPHITRAFEAGRSEGLNYGKRIGKNWREQDVTRSGGRFQTPARQSRMSWTQTPPTEYETAHSPPGGVTIAGIFYPGGSFIPGEELAKASPDDRRQLDGTGGTNPQTTEGMPLSDDSVRSGGIQEEADAKSRTILERLRGLPRSVVMKAKANIQDKYQKLVARYGPKYAKLILGAGVASLPVPVPGASLAFAAPLMAIAEMHRAISGGVALGGNYARYADDEQPVGDTPYDPNAERERARQGFEQAIDENPQDSTVHGVYADWLDENGEPDEAAFRRAMHKWADLWRERSNRGFHRPDMQPSHPWIAHVDYVPEGVNGGQMEVWSPSDWGTFEEQNQQQPPDVGMYLNKILRYPTYRGMESAFRKNFMESLRRQREQHT